MLKYVLRKLIVAIITIIVIVTAVFMLVRLLPGDPFMDPKVPLETQQRMREYYGLDKPMFEQYMIYMGKLLQGDLGTSLRTQNRSINEVIITAFPYSIDLGLRALVFAVVAGLLLGIVAALNQNRLLDNASMTLAVIGVSIPSFIVGSLLQYFFAVRYQWLPVALWSSPLTEMLRGSDQATISAAMGWEALKTTILPTFALGFGSVATIARLTRTSMLEVSYEDYIKTAKAKGLNSIEVTFKHKLRNALLPVITVMGPLIATLLTGTFVIENIFAIPGLGRHYVISIQNLDYPLITGMTIVYSVFLIVMQFVVDILYGVVDPRIKLVKGK